MRRNSRGGIGLSASLLVTLGLSIGGSGAAPKMSQTPSADKPGAAPVVIIQAYEDGLAGIRTASPDVHVRVETEPLLSGERVLIVEYPAPGDNPAERDVRCTATQSDWTSGNAIAFQVRPDHALRLSVSFLDRNHVAYTAWRELKGGEWQEVRIPFAEIRPNPFFQPPDARTGQPVDVSEVGFIAFAPQDKTSGRLAIGRFVVTK
jgi:carbohydrate binding protein with CBM11 domain